MQNENLVAAVDFCSRHHIEVSFIKTLNEYGLIELNTLDENIFIPADELQKLEKIIHLHVDLDINLEGVEAINYLLERVTDMQQEMMRLRNKLRFYEGL